MRLIYRCQHCGAQHLFDAPFGFSAESLLQELDRPNPMVRPWIRHPCSAGMHGIANLVAIANDSPTTYQSSAAPGGDIA